MNKKTATYSGPVTTRCWCYISHGCRAQATHSVRIGSHVYQFCSDPKHTPTIQGGSK